MNHIYSTEAEVIIAYAKYFIKVANTAIQKRDQFNVALSGGSSPKKVFKLLTSNQYRTQIDWTKVYFFFGDERYVPADSEDYNGQMAAQSLFEPLNIKADHIFYVDTSLSPSDAAADYAERIMEHFSEQPIRFDLIMLGLGDDAHTASLFPFTSAVHETQPTVTEVYVAKMTTFRITLSAPLINQARQIAFLVFGKNKAQAVEQVMRGERSAEQFPAQLIESGGDEVHWFLDGAASG